MTDVEHQDKGGSPGREGALAEDSTGRAGTTSTGRGRGKGGGTVVEHQVCRGRGAGQGAARPRSRGASCPGSRRCILPPDLREEGPVYRSWDFEGWTRDRDWTMAMAKVTAYLGKLCKVLETDQAEGNRRRPHNQHDTRQDGLVSTHDDTGIRRLRPLPHSTWQEPRNEEAPGDPAPASLS